MLHVRTPKKEDWQQINWLASNEVQEADHAQFESNWTKQRQRFDGKKYESVLLQDDEVVAFCSLEQDNDEDSFRAFIVLDWSIDDSEVREVAFEHLQHLIDTSGTSRVWMRELKGDKTLIDALLQHDFRIEKRYELDGVSFINLSKRET